VKKRGDREGEGDTGRRASTAGGALPGRPWIAEKQTGYKVSKRPKTAGSVNKDGSPLN